MKKFKRYLEGFPVEIVDKMLDRQEQQGNKRNVSIFERDKWCSRIDGGFKWHETEEGLDFWYETITNRNFDVFFEKYPKNN